MKVTRTLALAQGRVMERLNDSSLTTFNGLVLFLFDLRRFQKNLCRNRPSWTIFALISIPSRTTYQMSLSDIYFST